MVARIVEFVYLTKAYEDVVIDRSTLRCEIHSCGDADAHKDKQRKHDEMSRISISHPVPHANSNRNSNLNTVSRTKKTGMSLFQNLDRL